ncbi:MAG: YtxH domain-containing protein [Anaerolineales bacterium]|jgi:gas vesicle protein
MNGRDSDFGVFLAGFFIGGLIGAAVALLLAPQSGEETRILIKDKSIELKDKASTTADDYYSRAGEYASSTLERGQQVIDEQRTRLEAAMGTSAPEPASEEVVEEEAEAEESEA